MTDLVLWEPFMLTPSREIEMDQFLVKARQNTRKALTLLRAAPNRRFSPPQQDSLFWCFYIMRFGFANYGTISMANIAVEEKRLKHEYILRARKEKMLLKTFKILLIKDNIENELANESRIGLKTFLALCILERMCVMIVHQNKCFQLTSDAFTVGGGGGTGDGGIGSGMGGGATDVMDTDDECDEEDEEEDEEGIEKGSKPNKSSKTVDGRLAGINVVHVEDLPLRYSLESNLDDPQWTKYQTKYFPWQNLDKPLRAISAYKVDELRDICQRLEIAMPSPKMTKQQLFDLLCEKL